jgi:hypothetical protein
MVVSGICWTPTGSGPAVTRRLPTQSDTRRRRLSGAHAVERYGGVDLAPLLAAELAVWALERGSELGPDDILVA